MKPETELLYGMFSSRSALDKLLDGGKYWLTDNGTTMRVRLEDGTEFLVKVERQP